jgi:hypothetical protein
VKNVTAQTQCPPLVGEELAAGGKASVMNTGVESYVRTVLLASCSAVSGVKVVRPRWWRLAIAASDPYHPEHYYMRGPGPKWREKHVLGAQKSGR